MGSWAHEPVGPSAYGNGHQDYEKAHLQDGRNSHLGPGLAVFWGQILHLKPFGPTYGLKDGQNH